MLRPIGMVADVELDGVNGGTMDMAWCEITFASSDAHEKLVDIVHDIFHAGIKGLSVFLIRALWLLISGELCNILDTCRMGTPLCGCKALIVCTNVLGLRPMGWSVRWSIGGTILSYVFLLPALPALLPPLQRRRTVQSIITRVPVRYY